MSLFKKLDLRIQLDMYYIFSFFFLISVFDVESFNFFAVTFTFLDNFSFLCRFWARFIAFLIFHKDHEIQVDGSKMAAV